MKKKNITIALLSLLLTSCDIEKYLDFYVQNDCNQFIVVNIATTDFSIGLLPDIDILDTIYPNSKTQIYQYHDIWPFTKDEIPYFLQEMKITKNEKNIRYDPLDTSKWDFKYTKRHYYEATLTVREEDFE